MKTIIVHPNDESTAFLKRVYKELTNCKIIAESYYFKQEIKSEIEGTNNLMIMGHGDLNGLFGINYSSKHMIDSSFCNLIESKNCLLIWCNADEFVSKNKLNFNGIFCGMFISQIEELIFLNPEFETEDIEILRTYQPMIDESNNAFSSILGNLLKENSFDDLPLIYEKLRLEYGAIAKKGNEVAAYNNELLYLSLVK